MAGRGRVGRGGARSLVLLEGTHSLRQQSRGDIHPIILCIDYGKAGRYRRKRDPLKHIQMIKGLAVTAVEPVGFDKRNQDTSPVKV